MFTYHGISIEIDEIIKYSRKSRADDPLLSVEEVLEKHEKILNEWCDRHFGERVPDNNSFREVVSGETIQARPEFQKVLRLIESPKRKAILTVEAQRLSRGDLEDAGRLIKLLRYTNTLVITPDMVFDLNDEYDRERFERELKRGNEYLEYYKKISWRGRLESVRAGWFIASIAPYGYDKVTVMDGKRKRPTLAINEREAEVVRLVFDLYVNHGIGATSIAHKLNDLGYRTRNGGLFTQASVVGMLSNEHYIGKVRWNWRKTVNVVENGEISKTRPKSKDYYIFDAQHPAIVDSELFERAQAKKGKTPRTKTSRQLINPLAGLVWCKCGKAMVYRTYKDGEGVERSAPRMLCTNQTNCHTQSVTYDDIISKVVDVLRQCIGDFEIQIKNDSTNTMDSHLAHIKRLEMRLEELEKKEIALWDKYSDENMPKSVFDRLNEKNLAEKKNVEKALLSAKENVPTVEDYREKVCRFTDALNALTNPDASPQLKNQLLKACIERIEYSREKGSRWQSTDFVLDVKLKV